MSIATYLNTGLALLGWAYIMFKAGQWIIKNTFRQWEKRRKECRRQKAVNELYGNWKDCCWWMCLKPSGPQRSQWFFLR